MHLYFFPFLVLSVPLLDCVDTPIQYFQILQTFSAAFSRDEQLTSCRTLLAICVEEIQYAVNLIKILTSES